MLIFCSVKPVTNHKNVTMATKTSNGPLCPYDRSPRKCQKPELGHENGCTGIIFLVFILLVIMNVNIMYERA